MKVDLCDVIAIVFRYRNNMQEQRMRDISECTNDGEVSDFRCGKQVAAEDLLIELAKLADKLSNEKGEKHEDR
jgi:hypothetical protein